MNIKDYTNKESQLNQYHLQKWDNRNNKKLLENNEININADFIV